MRLLGILATLVLAGCATPNTCFVNYDHLSFPTRGHPFFGPTTEEDSVDAVGSTCRWEHGRIFIESGLSYPVPGTDLIGNDLLYQGRIAYKIWEKR